MQIFLGALHSVYFKDFKGGGLRYELSAVYQTGLFVVINKNDSAITSLYPFIFQKMLMADKLCRNFQRTGISKF